MARLRHLAIATPDPEATASFYIDCFGLERLRDVSGVWGYGVILSDGHLNFAVLRFTTDAAAGVERGTDFAGLHHLGFEVDDVDSAAERVEVNGGRARHDITEALGIPHDAPVKGEFKFEGPDGVVFDLSEPGVWQVAVASAEGTDSAR